MFEAHGWATIRGGAAGDADGVGALGEPLRVKIAELNSSTNVVVRLELDLNGSDALTVTAFKNHRKESVIDLFRWLAQHLPGSYGLLHVFDDEDPRDSDGTSFRVWRLARGMLSECPDLFLSPTIPVVEDPYGGQGQGSPS